MSNKTVYMEFSSTLPVGLLIISVKLLTVQPIYCSYL